MENSLALSNKQKAVALLQLIGTDGRDALRFIRADGFLQHDPEIADGLEGYREWLSGKPASAKIDIIRVFEDGNYVFTHSLYTLDEVKAGFDIFRFEAGQAVEHWNNFQKVTKPNPSGRTLTDGPTEPAGPEVTEQNKALVRDFLNVHLLNGSDNIARFFKGDSYIQHNSGIPDGVSGLLATGKAYKEKGVAAAFTAIHQVLGDRNYVLAVSEGTVGADHLSFYDLYRLEDGKLAEHWDILETIKPAASWKNPNGKF